MDKLKQMSPFWLVKTILSPQATWTEIWNLFFCKYLNKDIKKG